MDAWQEAIGGFVLLWAVIDPVGTVPVFLAATAGQSPDEKRKTARIAATAAAGILLFFVIAGEVVLRAMGVPLLAFQIAGGIVLFLFALTMIFGESKPESESATLGPQTQTAIFPLATPSLASPGAMMAVVLLTENSRHSVIEQTGTAALMLLVVASAYGLMLLAGPIRSLIGDAGAAVVSRVMGMILASVAATNVLEGIKAYLAA